MDQNQLQTRLQNKVQARRAAEVAIQLLNESVAGDPVHYWKVIRESVLEKSPLSANDTPMTDVEAARFQSMTMPYGEYRDRPIADVPLSRLDWYARQNEEFALQLVRYLKNPNVKAQLQDVD